MLLRLFRKEKGVLEMNEEKIFEINKLLATGSSLNQLDKNGILECSRKAFKNRALKIGYSYDDSLKQFVYDGTVTPNNTDVTPRKSAAKNIKSRDSKKADNNQELLLNIDALEKRLKDLEDLVLHNNTAVTQDNVISLNPLAKGEVVTRSIKATKEALDAFNNIAEDKLSLYPKQQLFSQALLEFAEKYK